MCYGAHCTLRKVLSSMTFCCDVFISDICIPCTVYLVHNFPRQFTVSIALSSSVWTSEQQCKLPSWMEAFFIYLFVWSVGALLLQYPCWRTAVLHLDVVHGPSISISSLLFYLDLGILCSLFSRKIISESFVAGLGENKYSGCSKRYYLLEHY